MGITTTYQVLKGKKALGESVDIDKSGFELAAALDALGLDGSGIVLGLDEHTEDPAFLTVPAARVKEQGTALAKVTWPGLWAAYARCDYARDMGVGYLAENEAYLQGHFAALQQVYAAAVKAGAGLRISTC